MPPPSPAPASPTPFPDCRGKGERVPTPITSCGAMESGAAAASAPRGWRRRLLRAGAEERRGAEGPALSSLPHPAALRLEPVAQPAPHKCINSSHIMINSSVPVTRGGGTRRGAGAGERQGARERPFHRSSPPRRRAPPARREGGGGCAERPARRGCPCPARSGGGGTPLGSWPGDLTPPPRRHAWLPRPAWAAPRASRAGNR